MCVECGVVILVGRVIVGVFGCWEYCVGWCDVVRVSGGVVKGGVVVGGWRVAVAGVAVWCGVVCYVVWCVAFREVCVICGVEWCFVQVIGVVSR